MDIQKTRTIIGGLTSKLVTINEEDYDKSRTFEEFTKPFFEALGWDFQTDVKKPDSITENRADYAFQIDGVSRFYLSVVPPSKSLEDRKQILPLTAFAYNKGVTWAILTNFKETRVYNTEAPGTSPGAMQHYSFSFSEYISKFKELLNLTKKQFSLNVLDSDAEYFGKKPRRVPIDQQLLKDLLSYRDMLVDNIAKNNSITEEEAEQAVQKILNRLIFIRSCGDKQIEDRYLISSLSDWQNNKNKKLVEHLQEIFAYFRGRYGSSLFEKHACDNLIISDRVLEEIIEGLYASKEKSFLSYDFSLISSDVLGKMYENYLGTIQKKQDGAYYTPNYISKYIAENTIIPYLSKSDVTNIPDLISEYANNIKELESKIHNIKILDPACGTGEFLIRAIDILLKISKAIQNHKEKSGEYSHVGKKKKSELSQYVTFDKEIEGQEVRTIIQNNIFGVDINEEAIEITQLNLFLKLATSSKQLPDVSKNLRVGNSLIDDKSVDPKAFDWKHAFPEEFDIVIGNPPYVQLSAESNKKQSAKEYLIKRFESSMGRLNTFGFFTRFGIDILKNDRLLGFIIPNTILTQDYYEKLRKMILDSCKIKNIVNFSGLPFADAVVENVVLILEKTSIEKERMENDVAIIGVNDTSNFVKQNKISQKIFLESRKYAFGIFWDKNILLLKEKLETDSEMLCNFLDVNQAIALRHDRQKWVTTNKSAKNAKPLLIGGKNINRYSLDWDRSYLIYDLNGIHSSKDESIFLTKEKIIFRRVANRLIATLDTEQFYGLHTLVIMNLKSKVNYNLRYFLAIFNSKLMTYYYQKIFASTKTVFSEIGARQVDLLPIKIPDHKIEKRMILLVDKMLSLHKCLDEVDNEKTNERIKIEEKISITDSEIDELVYKLYNITEEEKKIIESSF